MAVEDSVVPKFEVSISSKDGKKYLEMDISEEPLTEQERDELNNSVKRVLLECVNEFHGENIPYLCKNVRREMIELLKRYDKNRVKVINEYIYLLESYAVCMRDILSILDILHDGRGSRFYLSAIVNKNVFAMFRDIHDANVKMCKTYDFSSYIIRGH